jgi:site-specific recombinase XerD
MATTYHFYLRKDKKRDNGECPIYLRITQNRKSRYLSTGVFIKPKFWNPNKEEVRKSHRNYKSLNSILDKEQDKAESIQAELSRYGKDSAKAIQKRLKQQEAGDFFDLADEYLENVKAEKSYYTHKNNKVAIDKVEAFEGERSLPLKHIDTAWLERFEQFLKQEYNNHPNTINKNFRPIRAVIKKALKRHLISVNPLNNFEGAKRAKPQPKTKLSINQIRAIEEFDFEKGSNLWHTRNYFMFSFYSGGIRFGDLCCLKWKDIKEGHISYQMNKNKKPFRVELNQYQQNILDCYSENKKTENYIFPILNNHKDYSDSTYLRKRISSKNALINKWLGNIAGKVNAKLEKEKSKIPKIENISFHVARHSFAQYAIDEKDLSMYELRQILRHSKIQTTEKYLKGLDEKLADKAMKKVF